MSIETKNITPSLEDATKTELKNLASAIELRSEKKEGFNQIDSLFDKISTLDENKKNLALQYALNDSELKIWSGNPKKLSELAELFEKHVEQDSTSRKLKFKENTELTDEDKAVLEPFLNEKRSAFAYLIQKSANFMKLQAEKGYGKKQTGLVDVGLDKVLGNQTRRALSGLKSWLEADLSKNYIENVKNLTLEDILKMSYISKDLMEKIQNEWNEEIKKLWESVWEEGSDYLYKAPYTSNYALKKKKGGVWGDDQDKSWEDIDQGASLEKLSKAMSFSLGAEENEQEFNESLQSFYKDKDLSDFEELTIKVGKETFVYSLKGLDLQQKVAALQSLPEFSFEADESNENKPTSKEYVFQNEEWQEKVSKQEEKFEKMNDLINDVSLLLHEDVDSDAVEKIKNFSLKSRADGSFSFWDVIVKKDQKKRYTFSIAKTRSTDIIRSNLLGNTETKTVSFSLENPERAKKIAVLMNIVFAFVNNKETGTDKKFDVEWDNFGVDAFGDNNPFYFWGLVKWRDSDRNPHLTFNLAGGFADDDIIAASNLKALGLSSEEDMEKFASFLTNWGNYKFDND